METENENLESISSLGPYYGNEYLDHPSTIQEYLWLVDGRFSLTPMIVEVTEAASRAFVKRAFLELADPVVLTIRPDGIMHALWVYKTAASPSELTSILEGWFAKEPTSIRRFIAIALLPAEQDDPSGFAEKLMINNRYQNLKEVVDPRVIAAALRNLRETRQPIEAHHPSLAVEERAIQAFLELYSRIEEASEMKDEISKVGDLEDL